MGNQNETHEFIFSWLSWLAVFLVGAYARRLRRSPVTQHGSHTPNNGLTETCSLGLLVYFFDIGHPGYHQLTPVKTRYPLTSVT